MKKGKKKSQFSVLPEPSAIELPPLDVLTVKIKSIRITEDTPVSYFIHVTFYDQLILTGTLESTPARATTKDRTVLKGSMPYNPSDLERMCIIPGYPLCVQIQPLKIPYPIPPMSPISSQGLTSHASSNKPPSTNGGHLLDISCCNIDILSLFIDKEKKHLRKRMQPRIKPSVLAQKSWDNLPLLNLKVEVERNPLNKQFHDMMTRANWMQMTLVGAYNMIVPHCDDHTYTAASRMPLQNGTEFGLVTFGQGYGITKRFSSLNFLPMWESLRLGDRNFTDAEAKFEYKLEDIQNDEDIPLKRYLDKPSTTTIWGSSHRTLMLENADSVLWKHIRRYDWPLEVHIYGETQGFSFMAFMNLFKLLYPGENTVLTAVPLQWIKAEAMHRICGCDLLLTPNEKASVHTKTARMESPTLYSHDSESLLPTTGADDNSAFVLVEVKLARPLRKVVIPPYIPPSELNDMLGEIERAGPKKRECTGRRQQDRDWQITVSNAACALRKVPYYGATEFCQFNRQLSETRTRVELITSCWQNAAIYINNNFVVQDFLNSDETFEEMIIMAHACLMKSASATLVGPDHNKDADTTLRAARHARQMQDISHATELYLQVVVDKPRDADCWRELSTCLKDVERDWANVCINKAVVLDPRHPLSLLSKGCMLFEEDPTLAEPFFVALMGFHPFWSVGWLISSVYYKQRELFHMADQVLDYSRTTTLLSKTEDFNPPRLWENELGDWWDYTPILPGMSPYYNAADLLLRLRCIKLAESCMSLALCEGGETAVYYHLVALCCRLQGSVEDALCHARAGLHKYGEAQIRRMCQPSTSSTIFEGRGRPDALIFGTAKIFQRNYDLVECLMHEISYLRTLEAECYHKLNDIPAANASFIKAGSCTGSFSTLLSLPCREQQRVRATLVDLSRRQPSAYVWMALADDWMTRAAAGEADEDEAAGQTAQAAAKTCAVMCTIQALKWDRRASKAWALLAELVKPSARRLHCMQMAYECGDRSKLHEKIETSAASEQSLCYHLGRTLKECCCMLCEKTKV